MRHFPGWHFILKPFSWIRTPSKYRSFSYFIFGDQLYTPNTIDIKNSRILFRKIQFKSHIFNDVTGIEEEMYLLMFYEDNIAHFFHDIFFSLYVAWRNDKKKIFVSINQNQFQKDFLISTFGLEYLVFADPSKSYGFKKLLLVPEGRKLDVYPNYIEICKEIKFACFANNNIKELRTKNILYGRNELKRKNLLNIDNEFLIRNNIQLVYLSQLNFFETIKLLSETKNFIYMVGAGVFYFLFLDENVQVLEINPVKNNSWAQMFGLSKLCKLSVLISQNIQKSSHAMQGEAILDSHVFFDSSIKQAILKLPL